jgi:hypothetical protein
MVRLHRSTGDHGIGIGIERSGEVELQLPDLVSRQTEPGEIIPLDPDRRASPSCVGR